MVTSGKVKELSDSDHGPHNGEHCDCRVGKADNLERKGNDVIGSNELN